MALNTTHTDNELDMSELSTHEKVSEFPLLLKKKILNFKKELAIWVRGGIQSLFGN